MRLFENLELKTRSDVAAALLELLRPLKSKYSPGHAWLLVGDSGAHYGEKAARMEGFSRVLWGLGPLWAGDNSALPLALQAECLEWLELYRDGFVHGTDPKHEEYWGDVADYDQKMVEMAALVTAISLSPQLLWNPLDEMQKSNLYRWLNKINEKEVHPNNWRFFRILVNMMFRLLDLPWSNACMEDDFAVIEGCYTQDGWYYDGTPNQVDYYIPFAMHYYGLLYANFMETADPERANRLKQRGQEFAQTFPYWFANDGNEIPFGRSLTYRFAHSACFSALGFAEVEGPGFGVMKHLALKNLETWLNRPIFDNGGVLSIGYGYPNLFMSERYNAPGSPYWGLKAFLMLALPETHPFWTEEAKEFDFEPQKLMTQPHMLITHDANHHVMAFTAGQHGKVFGTTPEKYEKFVYSNQFGFSVSRGFGMEEGAFDNTLAVSFAGENRYQMRYGADSYEVLEDRIWVKYHITPKVLIESTIIPFAPWHVRIHKIKTEERIDVADGGFALETERWLQVVPGTESGKFTDSMVETTKQSINASFPWGASAARCYTEGRVNLVSAFPNTNLLYHLTVIPTVEVSLEAGEHLVVTAMMADRSVDADAWLGKPPVVVVNDTQVVVEYDGIVKIVER